MLVDTEDEELIWKEIYTSADNKVIENKDEGDKEEEVTMMIRLSCFSFCPMILGSLGRHTGMSMLASSVSLSCSPQRLFRFVVGLLLLCSVVGAALVRTG